MSIKEQLTADMKEAMKSHDKDRLSVIRFVRDEDVIGVISKEVKMRKDSIEEFKKGGREDLVAKTQAEIDVLMPYLPAQLSEDEIRALVKEAVEKTGASTPKDMGKVMGMLMPKVKGRADGKLVNTIVRSMLQG